MLGSGHLKARDAITLQVKAAQTRHLATFAYGLACTFKRRSGFK